MPVGMLSYFVPSADSIPYLLEDSYLKGGYRVFDTLAARDEWTTGADSKSFGGIVGVLDARKEGMLCYVVETGIIYKLTDDKLVWVELELGSDYEVEAPLSIIGENRLTIDPNRIVPEGGDPGQVLGRDSGGELVWLDMVSSAGTRSSVSYTMPDQLASGESHDFTIPDVGKTVMMLTLTVNAYDLKVEGWTSLNRDDGNPYTFVSTVSMLTDEGIKEEDDGTLVKYRRYSFLANQDSPVSRDLHFTFTNMGDTPISPEMTLTYLVLE